MSINGWIWKSAVAGFAGKQIDKLIDPSATAEDDSSESGAS
jgi:hypothetical protein